MGRMEAPAAPSCLVDTWHQLWGADRQMESSFPWCPKANPAPPSRVQARTECTRGCPMRGRLWASAWLSRASLGMARTRGRCECRGAHWRN